VLVVLLSSASSQEEEPGFQKDAPIEEAAAKLLNQDAWDDQAWWYSPIIPALRRLRQENLKFKTRLGYIGRPCHKKPNKAEKGPPESWVRVFRVSLRPEES
jgi:hypothetical protein